MTNKEYSFILQQTKAGLTSEQIAIQLNRNVETVEKYIRDNYIPPNPEKPIDKNKAEKIQVRQELRSSQKWKRLKEELTDEEIKYVEEEYVNLMTQFKGDVLATEENQILDAVKFQILQSRNLMGRRRALDDIERLEKQRDKFIASKQGGGVEMMSDEDHSFLLNIETQISAAKTAEHSMTGEYVKLQERVDALWRSLKSTRDQRIKQIESSKISFLGLVKALQDRDLQEREGRQTKLMEMAANKEYDRLGEYHEYVDGNADRPILSADTIGEDDD